MMPGMLQRVTFDPALACALALSLALCMLGINWGITEPWNPDQTAYYDAVTEDGRLDLHPGDFLKPPFHKYFNLVLARVPAYAVSELFGFSEIERRKVTLVWSRVLTTSLFLAQIVLVYAIVKQFFGLFAARVLCLVYATGAGFLAYSHFLTSDIPVTTGMLAAFYFAQNVLLRGRLSDYILAGSLTGIAAATKYNGLAIGITFVIAHALRRDWRSWASQIFDRRLILGLAAVPLAFMVANPYSVLDARTFVSNFMYNLAVTPVYSGEDSGNNYLEYWWHVIEIVGLPGFLLLVPAVISGIWIAFRSGLHSVEGRAFAMLLSVSLLYYVYFGSFPRLVTRFVLPVVPYLIIMAGPACERLRSTGWVFVVPCIGLLLFYNVICSTVVGLRFANDPRIAARSWLRDNLPAQAVVEFSLYAPNPYWIEGADFEGVFMPIEFDRRQLFSEKLAANTWVTANLERFEKSAPVDWYSPRSLRERAPDAIVINSLYYGRFFKKGKKSTRHPEIAEFFSQLLEERLGYVISFDRESADPHIWAYPRKIDSLHNRIVILVPLPVKE